MSDIASPESATASFTAVSAWTASGTSAVRETFEKPTPLTATLHRFSHIGGFSKNLANAKGAKDTRRTQRRFDSASALHVLCVAVASFALPNQLELRERDVVVQFLEHDLDAAADLRLGVFGVQQISGHQRARRIIELDDDAGVGHRGREALVAGVIHDRVGVDRADAAHGLESEVGGDASRAGRVRRVLEMPATLTALQFDDPALRRVPKRLGPLVRHRDRPGHLAPVAHDYFFPRSLRCAGKGIGGSSALPPLGTGASRGGERLSSSSATMLRISGKPGGALRPN